MSPTLYAPPFECLLVTSALPCTLGMTMLLQCGMVSSCKHPYYLKGVLRCLTNHHFQIWQLTWMASPLPLRSRKEMQYRDSNLCQCYTLAWETFCCHCKLCKQAMPAALRAEILRSFRCCLCLPLCRLAESRRSHCLAPCHVTWHHLQVIDGSLPREHADLCFPQLPAAH